MFIPRVTVFGAAVLLALAAGCKREEPKPAAPPPPLSQAAPEPAPPAAPAPGTTSTPAGRTVGQTVDDATITGRVKAELLKAADVKGTDINVDTVNGTVTLKGTVETQADVDRAATVAKTVEGVKDVQNTLTVKSGK